MPALRAIPFVLAKSGNNLRQKDSTTDLETAALVYNLTVSNSFLKKDRIVAYHSWTLWF